jgi:hypothetical protein
MKESAMVSTFRVIGQEEKKLHHHGRDGPSTFKRNQQRQPIDGIWVSQDLRVSTGGYMQYDSITPSEHRYIWIEISFQAAFGHNMPALQRPQTRRLHCRDPRIVSNYTKVYLKLASKSNYFTRIQCLDKCVSYPSSPEMCQEYEQLDNLCCDITRGAEKKKS